jgi:hypothetical protein
MNYKKILCYNFLNDDKCIYGNKCMFAHSLKEQIKNKNRKKIISIIENEIVDLSFFSVLYDENLYNDMIIFTKECNKCLEKKCNGGYNCKNGVCLLNLKICKNDLLYGNCVNEMDNNYCCQGIHLSKKNLIPLNIQLKYLLNKNINNNDEEFKNNKLILNDENISKIDKYIYM